MLEFHDDAICLSGITGTAIKCDIIGQCYKFWWKITSGGDRNDHRFETAIIEFFHGPGPSTQEILRSEFSRIERDLPQDFHGHIRFPGTEIPE